MKCNPFPQPVQQPNSFPPTLESCQVQSLTVKSSKFRPPTQASSRFACAYTKNKWFSPRVRKPSKFRPPPQQQNMLNPYTETRSSSIHHRDQGNYDDHYERQVNVHAYSKNMRFSTRTQKQGRFWHPHKRRSLQLNQVNLYPHTEPSKFRPQHWSDVNFDPRSKGKCFRILPDAKIELISIQTLNQVISDYESIIISTLKSSQLRSPTLKSRLFRSPTQQPSQFRCQH